MNGAVQYIPSPNKSRFWQLPLGKEAKGTDCRHQVPTLSKQSSFTHSSLASSGRAVPRERVRRILALQLGLFDSK